LVEVYHFPPQQLISTNTNTGQTLEIGSPDTASLRIDDVILANSESVALKDGLGNVLTYAQLGERVNTVSSSLLDAGVRENMCVAVYQEPTSDWVCSLLAIWKIGAAFIPLDPRNPMQRLATIANDCKPTAILCHKQTSSGVAELKPSSTKVIDITELVQETRNSVVSNRSKADSQL
jgi:Acyl-CoA synthetases (AMP-forming)/AMP-acid ligases II